MNFSKMRPGHVLRAAELLGTILDNPHYPADAQMDRYFKAHKEMGKQDRAFVAEAVYGVLRSLRLLDARLGETLCKAREVNLYRLGAFLAIYSGYNAKALEAKLEGYLVENLMQALRAHPSQDLPMAVRLSLPDEAYAAWVEQWGEEKTQRLAEAFLKAAPADIRVNSLKQQPESLQAAMTAAGFTLKPLEGIPGALRQEDRANLFRTPMFQAGDFEMQDVGSQIIGALLPVKPGQKVTDFCAGAGGKTLQLATAMHNKGTILAFDINGKRLERMRPRLARAGVDNVRTQKIASEKDAKLKKYRATQDAVLVDAPCSGSGTWRRSPDTKWRSLDLIPLNTTQASVLESAAKLVKPQGYLVYATCSLMRSENQNIVEAFLAQHPQFVRLPCHNFLAEKGYKLADSAFTSEGDVQLNPADHNTDGFYACLMQHQEVVTE